MNMKRLTVLMTALMSFGICACATAQDVRQLMQQIQDKVFEKFGVRLEPEIKLVGEW